MARISTGPIIGEARGKTGDKIFSRNNAGPYVKAFAIPTNPNTTLQQQVRQAYIESSPAWQALTDAERLQWDVAAREYNAQRALSRGRPISGWNLFQKQYVMFVYYGYGSGTLPAPKRAIPTVQISADADAFSNVFNVTIDTDAWLDTSFIAVVNISGPLSAGRKNVQQGLMSKFISNAMYGFSSTYDMRFEWELKFGSLSGFVGKAIFLSGFIMDTTNANRSPVQFTKTTIHN